MATISENNITQISSNIFYKEFTFNKNQFIPDYDNQSGIRETAKELADNILWLNNLLFIIQVKERQPSTIKSEVEENKWFKNTVLNKAKKQINDSVNFFKNCDEIKIKNVRDHEFDIAKANLETTKKIIIYSPNSDLISDENKSIKLSKTWTSGNIHIFSDKDYFWICKILITPTELNEYLQFRERFCIKHHETINLYSEQYIISHFLATEDEGDVRSEFVGNFENLINDLHEYDVSFIINNFQEKLRDQYQNSTQYYFIIKEIALLKRYELKEFKQRYIQAINDVSLLRQSYPYRFTCDRSNCGFVFIPLQSEQVEYWENYLISNTEIYKYRRKIQRCIGMSVYKTGEYFDVNWAYIDNEWVYDEELEGLLSIEDGIYGAGEIFLIERYKLNNRF